MKNLIRTSMAIIALCHAPLILAMPQEMPVDETPSTEAPAETPVTEAPPVTEMPAETTPTVPEATPQVAPTEPVDQTPPITAPTSNTEAQKTPEPATKSSSNPATELARTEVKKGIETINTALESISSTKGELKTILGQADEAVEKAKQIVAQARKESLSLLKQATEDAAQKTHDGIKAQLDELNGIMKKMNDETSAEMQKKIESIKSQMADVEKMLTQTREKNTAIKATVALEEQKQEDQASAQKADKKNSRAWLISEKKQPEAQQAQEPTFIHYIMRRVADFISATARIIYATITTIKDKVMGRPEEKGAASTATSAVVDAPAPTQQAQPLAAGDAPAALNSGTLTQPHEAIFEKIVIKNSQMHTDYTTVNNNLLLLVQNLKSLDNALAVMPALSKLDETVSPAWKKTAEQGFSTVLDYVIISTRTIQAWTYKLYSVSLKPLFDMFKSDVQKQIQR